MTAPATRFKKLIHLLYVPTLHCNLGCEYCYLGEQTSTQLAIDESKAADTLQSALDTFIQADILPFNVSLHGGEVTTLSQPVLSDLFSIINKHYLRYYDVLSSNGFKKINPHIKTNLFNLDTHIDFLKKHNVSISGSVDLPLSKHAEFRITKNKKSSLGKIEANLKLLAEYPHSKKISATLFQEHFENTSQIIEDIWHIHNHIGFDMNQFNFMFGFNSLLNDEKFENTDSINTSPISQEQQVQFYLQMKEAFMGTELEYGFKHNWFDEFKPSYCTNARNCGERFFLLQSDGAIYSCVRGQGSEEFYYGNIFTDSAEHIINNAQQKIRQQHQQAGLHEDCKECEFLPICNTGCAFVKKQTSSGKSYTCLLQKEIYKDNSISYPVINTAEKQKIATEDYTFEVHPHLLKQKEKITFKITPEVYEQKNMLLNIIEKDAVLQSLYADDAFFIETEDETISLSSQILKAEREIYNFDEEERIVLHIRKALFDQNCNDPIRNTLHLQMLRDTKVIYGDEQRQKQEHIFTFQVYRNMLLDSKQKGEDFYEYDLSPILKANSVYFMDGVINNLFFTTLFLREYHYTKQKQNAFYHIQAINLPFQNLEFYWHK